MAMMIGRRAHGDVRVRATREQKAEYMRISVLRR